MFERFTKPVRWALLLLVLSFGLVSACSGGTELTESDETEIYAAVIRQLYTVDDTFGGTLNAPAVYVVRGTDDSVGDPDAEETDTVQLSQGIQDGVLEALADLPADVSWVGSFESVTLDSSSGQAAGGGVIVTLGNIHAQKDGSTRVSASIYIANLAAGGQTYIVEMVDGGWQVTGDTGVHWIS